MSFSFSQWWSSGVIWRPFSRAWWCTPIGPWASSGDVWPTKLGGFEGDAAFSSSGTNRIHLWDVRWSLLHWHLHQEVNEEQFAPLFDPVDWFATFFRLIKIFRKYSGTTSLKMIVFSVIKHYWSSIEFFFLTNMHIKKNNNNAFTAFNPVLMQSDLIPLLLLFLCFYHHMITQ